MKISTNVLSMALAGSMFIVTMGTTAAMCEEADAPTADFTLGLYSKYVWRGYELSKDSLVIQPSVTVGYKGFAFNLWGNLDTDQTTDSYSEDDNNWNETDMTAPMDCWGIRSVIFIMPGWYITLDVSHSFDLMDKLALNLGAKVSYLAVDDASTLADPNDSTFSYSDFHDGVLSMSLSYTR